MMKVWAIRDKGNGFFMPANPPSKHRKPYSGQEPKKEGGSWGPRLFPSLKSAQNSLTAWLAGEWGYRLRQNEWEDLYELDVTHKPYRKKENMEIVEFNLMEE